MAASPAHTVYYAQLRDRFDDSGIIAVVIVQREETTATIDTLLMSCRVIGRGVERAIVARIAADAAAAGCTRLVGEYIATARERPGG